jgi:hypothetical protein
MPVLLSILSAFFAVDEELEDVRPGLPNLALVRLAGLQGCDLLHVNASFALSRQPCSRAHPPSRCGASKQTNGFWKANLGFGCGRLRQEKRTQQ